jgi:hypothetical protein
LHGCGLLLQGVRGEVVDSLLAQIGDFHGLGKILIVWGRPVTAEHLPVIVFTN